MLAPSSRVGAGCRRQDRFPRLASETFELSERPCVSPLYLFLAASRKHHRNEGGGLIGPRRLGAVLQSSGTIGFEESLGP